IVRSDAVIPTNGVTIAILRRDVVAFVVPAKSPIDKISSLAGKTIGIPQGPLQTYNEQTLDSILSYYNIPATAVKRVFLPLAEIGAAVHDKQVVAVLAVGPIGPGEVFRDKDSHGSSSFSADRNSIARTYTRPKRLTASALTVRELPNIDIVLLSQAHFDHFDMRTLHRFDRSTTVITARRTRDLLRWTRFHDVTELRWKEIKSHLSRLQRLRSREKQSSHPFRRRHCAERFVLRNCALPVPWRGSNPSSLAITKDAIFHYVYGVLHDPIYREKYAQNLKREFPRIPFYPDFWRWADWGEALMQLHIDYESVEPWPLARTDAKDEKAAAAGLAPKPILKADKEHGIIVLDSETQLSGVPREAWDYRLGNRSALEWILDLYKEKTPKDSTIREKFNTYRFADHKER
ncbi:MAG TPA: type ISP restriction/modification enzyme, partial [Chthoniobacterales bacterium]